MSFAFSNRRILLLLVLCSIGCGGGASPATPTSRGESAFEKGDFDVAIEEFSKAVRINPKDAHAYRLRGAAWRKKKKLDAAIDDGTEAIRLDPTNASAYYHRGATLADKGSFDAAIADATKAIQIDPKFAKAYNLRGAALIEKVDQVDAAILDFTEAIRLDPTMTWAYFNRGRAWAKKGNFEASVDDETKAIRLDANLGTAYFYRGNSLRLKGDFVAALRDFNQAIRLAPDADTYSVAAWILATSPDDKVLDGKKAVEFATKACELNQWKVSQHIAVLAASYAEAGYWENAIKNQEQAITMNVDGEYKGVLKERLELFRQHKPYRVSAKK